MPVRPLSMAMAWSRIFRDVISREIGIMKMGLSGHEKGGDDLMTHVTVNVKNLAPYTNLPWRNFPQGLGDSDAMVPSAEQLTATREAPRITRLSNIDSFSITNRDKAKKRRGGNSSYGQRLLRG